MSTGLNRLVLAIGLVFVIHGVALAQRSSPGSTGEEPELTNLTCPVEPGEEIDPEFTTMYKGVKVSLCCRKCLRRFERDPEAYMEELGRVLPASFGGAALAVAQVPEPDGHAHDEGGGHDDAVAGVGEQAGQDGTAGQDESAGHDGTGGHEDAEEHDHSTGHGQAEGFDLLSLLGRFHVIVIHFPIALLILGGVMESLGVVRRQWRSDTAVRVLIGFGALSAVAAVVLGLLHGTAADYPGDQESWIFWWHRLLGISTGVLALITWGAVEWRARRARDKRGLGVTAIILVVAAMVGLTGHFGGSLVYGWEFLLP